MPATPSHPLIGAGQHGALGVGPGMAIGAQIAHPQQRVVHITGDGAMDFNIQGFDTQVRHGLPVLTVVCNNRLWGMSAQGQTDEAWRARAMRSRPTSVTVCCCRSSSRRWRSRTIRSARPAGC